MVLLVGAVLLTVLLGDRVGVTLQRVGPLGTARTTSSVVMQFSETMNRESVPSRLKVVQIPPDKANTELQPADILATIEGTVNWNGATLNFRPAKALNPGATYQVILGKGAASETGREVLSEYRYSFTVNRQRVAYLAPASGLFNIWIADPADPAEAQQLTTSPSGINDFSVSPDGEKIAFSEKNSATGTSDVKVLDLESGGIEQVTNCVDADCTAPVWKPDGQMIAYERVDYNTNLSAQVGPSPTRIWLIDLSTRPASTRPLFADTQILGYGLQWSADGQTASLFDRSSAGILVHDFTKDVTVVIPSQYGNPGQLSPDGTKVIYPEVVLDQQARNYLKMANLTTQDIVNLSDPADPIDDGDAVWGPDGRFIVFSRLYLDDRYTRGKQLYRMNMTDNSLETLLYDPQYQNGFFSLDPTGTQLVIQRFPDPVAMNDPNNLGLPGIWTLDLATKALVQVADDAWYGRWVP